MNGCRLCVLGSSTDVDPLWRSIKGRFGLALDGLHAALSEALPGLPLTE